MEKDEESKEERRRSKEFEEFEEPTEEEEEQMKNLKKKKKDLKNLKKNPWKRRTKEEERTHPDTHRGRGWTKEEEEPLVNVGTWVSCGFFFHIRLPPFATRVLETQVLR